MFTEIIKVLKIILDLENPVGPKKDSYLISLLEISKKDDYIITIDIKMILILYRIIANIPVILMGETGNWLNKKIKSIIKQRRRKIINYKYRPELWWHKIKKKNGYYQ